MLSSISAIGYGITRICEQLTYPYSNGIWKTIETDVCKI